MQSSDERDRDCGHRDVSEDQTASWQNLTCDQSNRESVYIVVYGSAISTYVIVPAEEMDGGSSMGLNEVSGGGKGRFFNGNITLHLELVTVRINMYVKIRGLNHVKINEQWTIMSYEPIMVVSDSNN